MKYVLLLLLLGAPAWAQTVRLDIHASPPEATIVVDREIRGTGEVTLTLPAGTHLIRVSAGENYLPQTKEMNLTADTKLNVRLEPGATRLLERGRTLLAQGKNAQAEELFAQATKQPRQVQPWWWLGVSRWKQGQFEPALAAFRRYAQYEPKHPELYLYLGDIHERQGRAAEAFTAYKNALILRPDYQDALAGLPPATDANLAKQGQPKDPKGQLRLAQLLMLKGSLRDALQWVSKAVDTVYPNWTTQEFEAQAPAAPPDPTLPKEGPQR